MSDDVSNTPFGDILRRQTTALKQKRLAHFRDIKFKELRKQMESKAQQGKNELVLWTELPEDFVSWLKNEHKIQYAYDPKRVAYILRW